MWEALLIVAIWFVFSIGFALLLGYVKRKFSPPGYNARMAWLLLSLHLCWDPNIEPDLLGYWVQSAERHVVEWVVCPCEPGVPCPQHVMCPVYNSFAWEWTFTGYLTDFQRFDCANVPGSICYYKHPLAEDESGNLSEQPMLLFPPPVSGNCP